LTRLMSVVAGRLPADSSIKRELVNTALCHLQDVAYTRLREAGFDPTLVIDVGAYSGDWSRSVRRIFAKPRFLLVEARGEQEAALRTACVEIDKADYAINLLGATKLPTVPFSVNDTGSSIFPERSNVRRTEVLLPMSTLDAIVASKMPDCHAPIFLKLDVQGAELEILKGARQTLRLAEVVQLEVALLSYNEGAPTAAEVVAFMDNQEFAIYDISGFIRPQSHLLQIDVLFVKKSSKLRPSFFTYPSGN